MLLVERIKTTDEAYYKFVEELFIEAFPEEERRELELQRHFTDNNPLFYNNIILNGDGPVGLITYWNFGDFCYIEHFAISSHVRNGGYGKRVMEYIDEKLCNAIILEVELPTEEMSRRRIGFYQRLGYQVWETAYEQPPYRKGGSPVPMHLMAKGNLDCENDFARIKDKIYQEVYLVK